MKHILISMRDIFQIFITSSVLECFLGIILFIVLVAILVWFGHGTIYFVKKNYKKERMATAVVILCALVIYAFFTFIGVSIFCHIMGW